MELAFLFLIGGLAMAAFIGAAKAWRNRKERALRREMKRHLQGIGAGPYDPGS